MDRELTDRAARGDAEAFGLLVERYEKKVYHTARNICGHPEDACDLTQEIFLRVWKNLPYFRGESSFSTWLFRLTANVCLDFVRKRNRRHEISLTLSEQPDGKEEAELPDSRYEPEQEAERREQARAIREALGRLSPDHRAVLILRENGGLSYAEIAQALNLEEGTVKSRIARARLQMRNFLIAGGNFPESSSSNQPERR